MTNTGLAKIGWIGTGRMGFALSVRLLEAGYDVAVYNRTRSKAEPLAALGATVVDRPADLADRDVVFIMVSAPKDLQQVVEGDGGLLTVENVSPGVIIDSSTVSTEASAKIRALATAHGSHFLASPVSGNPGVIAAGKLTLAVSGPRETFESVEALLNTLGQGVTWVGDGEAARLVKIAHNVFLGIVTQAMAEITVLVEKGGVSREAFLAFLNDSVMGSTFTRYKTPAFVNLDFTPTFTMPLLKKDFDLGLDAARELGVPMPISEATAELVSAAVDSGHLLEDFAVLLLDEARRAGITLVSEDKHVLSGLEVSPNV
ncbi:NAD(P)-dependent oxidoreductase [Demequina lutea]|uniref:3-hydroxyisobutyrate dehydrogenase-like beta-hydroxyacid dehydrogenase n=1 Tax=Demequina lutea TaxID=431489 RepID=A0A7Y9Z8Z6_9MICO|nr:NAD(P)-dependent oxidoreductase [Demequina lutea]NYI40188.1 3-hydroxyisobutyrate dehydrogenase-like beta-hydroxyacid dehydrogenase [Demequina lutea]